MTWLSHVLGMDNASGAWYLAWSGWVADLSLISAAWVFYRKHNCHAAWCPRIGKHTENGTPYCTRHHPREEIRNQ